MVLKSASGEKCVFQVPTKLFVLLVATRLASGVGYCRSNPGREICTSQRHMTCQRDQRSQIVESNYDRPANSSVCDANCEPTAQAEPRQCLKAGTQCLQRLSSTDLVVVYKSCALQNYCNFYSIDKQVMTLPGPFVLHYLCIEESSTIDPCQFSGSRRTNASFLLPFNSPGCQRHCDITPLNTDRAIYLNYWFIQDLNENNRSVSDNRILYRFIFEGADDNPTWKTFHNSYYTDFERFDRVRKLEIQFGLQQPDIIRHLWVSFNDAEIEVSCKDFQEPTVGLTESEDAGPTLTTTHTLIIGLVGGALASSVVAVAFLLWRNRGRRNVLPAPRREWSRGSNNDLRPARPSASRNSRIADCRVYDEIREDTQDDNTNEVLSLPMAPLLPRQASQSQSSQRPRDHRQPGASQSAFRDNQGDPTAHNDGYVHMGGTPGSLGANADVKYVNISPTAPAGEGTTTPDSIRPLTSRDCARHIYVNDSTPESSGVDADGYLVPRSLISATDQNRHSDAPFEYIELWPDKPSTE